MGTIPVPAFAGEALDALVWRATGGGPAAVERALEANRHLAIEAAALPEGRIVHLPETDPAPAEVALVQLWD